MVIKELNKKNKIIFISIMILIIIFVIIFLFRKKEDKFVLNQIYSVYPDEVKELYSNMVSVSCYGDWYLNIPVDNGKKIDISKIDNNVLIDYVFSYMDKNNLLNDEIKLSKFEDVSKLLFYKDVDLVDLLDNYIYGDYVYNNDGRKIIRTYKECVSNENYVTHLYGYSFNEQVLSVDVNIGYLKNGILYDINDKKLGEYDGNPKNIGDKFLVSPYYRFNYVNVNGVYELDTVEFNIKF